MPPHDLGDDIRLAESQAPVWIALLGSFALLKAGRPVAAPTNGKTEALLSILAIRYKDPVPRDTLLALLWPNHDPALAAQSLNSLVHSLRKQFKTELRGAGLLVHCDGCYRLNAEAGVGIDLAHFEAQIQDGDRAHRRGEPGAAMACYERAVRLYRGDLLAGTDVYAAVERERLRAAYLTLLARIADYHYAQGDYPACLASAFRLVATDPYREDAHRLIMRCHVREGERAQALRQYQFCADILRAEFDMSPEPATTQLYEQIRHDPASL
jgi:DNA-binding SARP family transcriptional activator